MIIRQETEKDFKEVYKLVKDAFETARVSNGKEQDFVNEIRASESRNFLSSQKNKKN